MEGKWRTGNFLRRGHILLDFRNRARKRKEAVEQSGSPHSERKSKKSKKSVKPERLERSAIALLLVCEETVLLKSVLCVNGILKLRTNLFFL